MHIQPYLFFGGRAEEALQFYCQALGGEIVSLLRFSDAPPDAMPPGVSRDKVMHAHFQVGSTAMFASDGMGAGAAYSGFSLSLSVATLAEGQRVFGALAEGGEVKMPFGKTFWTDGFGQLVDRFGVAWMVSVDH